MKVKPKVIRQSPPSVTCRHRLLQALLDNLTVCSLHNISPECQTPSKRRTNELMDKRTDAGNRIWCILALKCDIWWRYFNDFPENLLANPGLLSLPLNVYEASRFVPPPAQDERPWQTQRTDGQSDVSCPSVHLFIRSSHRWSLTLAVYLSVVPGFWQKSPKVLSDCNISVDL